jgi:hypothetical protein
MCRIKPRTDEFVCLISVESSCEACIVRAQPRLHSAIGGVGEYCRPPVEAKNMGRKTWYKDIVGLLKDHRPRLQSLPLHHLNMAMPLQSPIAKSYHSVQKCFSVAHCPIPPLLGAAKLCSVRVSTRSSKYFSMQHVPVSVQSTSINPIYESTLPVACME